MSVFSGDPVTVLTLHAKVKTGNAKSEEVENKLKSPDFKTKLKGAIDDKKIEGYSGLHEGEFEYLQSASEPNTTVS